MAKIVLTGEERKTLRKGLARVWDEIASDVGAVENNEHAVELCIDADRLANVSSEAYSVWDKVRQPFGRDGYNEAISYVAQYVIQLV